MSIGSRSQSARTYLEKHLNTFPDSTKDELIVHGLNALQDTLPAEVEMSVKNVSIAIVGLKEDFHILTEEETGAYLGRVAVKKRGGDGGNDAPGSGPGSSQAPAVDDAVAMEEPAPDPIPIVATEERSAQ